MQALQLTEWQHSAELREVAQPDPGPGEVLLRVGGAGACHSDLHLMDEFPPGLVPWGPPFTLGHENAGWVEAMGSGVSGLDIGQPVAVYGPWGCGRCRRCVAGLENYCEFQAEIGPAGGGLGLNGGMAPYMLVPKARYLVPLGDLDPVEAAPLTDAGLTPYHAIKRSLPILTPGTTAVVIGVGGLGHMAIQMLRILTPAMVIAVDQRAEALSLAQEVGADHTVVAGEDAVTEVRELTGGRGADVVFDFVGIDATLAFGATLATPLGHLTIVGIGGGVVPVSFFGIAYEVSVASTYWGSLPELVEVLALASTRNLRVELHTYPLARATDAYDAMRSGSLQGRAVIIP